MRHPELHQSPKQITFKKGQHCDAKIELGQHTDGRWMWAYSVNCGFRGEGFGLSAKWRKFAADESAALVAAVAEIRKRYGNDERIAGWLDELMQPQLALVF